MARKPLTPEQAERARQRAREWYAANKDLAIANVKRWQDENPEKVSAYKAKHAEANREYNAQRAREYRANNPEKRRQAVKAWAAANPERVAEINARYRRRHAAIRAEKFRSYRKLNLKKVSESLKRWRAANKDKCRIHNNNRRARARGGVLSTGIVDDLMEKQRGKCACCRTDLRKAGHHIDHIMPLAKGGTNTDDNVQLLCPECNLSKHARHPVDFMQQRGFLL